MKKQPKRLELTRETVRSLVTDDLRAVQGGVIACPKLDSSSVSHKNAIYTKPAIAGCDTGDSC